MTCVDFNVLESHSHVPCLRQLSFSLSLLALALALALVHMVLQISFTNLRFYHLRKSGDYQRLDFSPLTTIQFHLYFLLFSNFFSALYDPLEKQNTHQIVNPLSVDSVGKKKKTIFFASDRMLFN